MRLAYLSVSNAAALLRLLPISDRDKDAEVLALRHQLAVLQRQLGPARVRFAASDRALSAALLYRLPRDVLPRLRLVVRPGTVLRRRAGMPSGPGPSGSGGRAPCARFACWCCARSVRIQAGGIAVCTASCSRWA